MKGQKVANEDRLAKTIIFAKNYDHAQFITHRIDVNYPNHAGHFGRVVNFQVGAYAPTLIDNFTEPEKASHIAVSVDMLNIGIDVPGVVNLVFFKVESVRQNAFKLSNIGVHLRLSAANYSFESLAAKSLLKRNT